MSAVKPDLGAIGICAALGSAIAGATLGGLFAIGYFEYTDTLAQGLYMLAVTPIAGAILAVNIGGPIGLALGLIISRWVGTSVVHAILTGALTGAAYPLFFLVTGHLMGAHGVSGVLSTFPPFLGLGAICGALAYCAVIGRATARRG